jgi:hypothetical protein
MKFVFILLFLLVFTAAGFSQISPDLKAGVGYVHVYDIDESVSPDYHTITGYPTVCIEKPFPIEINLKKRLSINPGLAWYIFKEEKIKGDTEKGKDFNLNHQTINGFVKVLYQAKFRGKTEAFIYGGGIGGMHLITKTKGTKYVYGLNVEIPEYDNPINENASDFFDMFYYGAVAGFQPNARKYNFIKPSFEVAYFPGFISKTKETVPITYQDINTIQVSIFLGFRIK